MAAAPGWRCLLPPVYTDWRLAAASAAAAAGGVGSSAQAAAAGQESADLTTSDDL